MPAEAHSTALPETELLADTAARMEWKFQALAQQWKSEKGSFSSITAISILPAYQKIIGMGENAIPLILEQLKSEGDEPDQWFWALHSISDANPVRSEDRGDFQAMARAWLAWGKERGYAC